MEPQTAPGHFTNGNDGMGLSTDRRYPGRILMRFGPLRRVSVLLSWYRFSSQSLAESAK
jgi:hypothetical protein